MGSGCPVSVSVSQMEGLGAVTAQTPWEECGMTSGHLKALGAWIPH